MALCVNNSEFIGSIITVIGIVFSTLIGFHQYRENKWCENVSKERTNWLKEFRQEVGSIMSAYALLDNQSNNNEKENLDSYCEIFKKAEEARYKLITRINTNKVKGNEYNFRYKEILMNINIKDKNTYKKEEFMNLTNLILEAEWQKVKREAKGKEMINKKVLFIINLVLSLIICILFLNSTFCKNNYINFNLAINILVVLNLIVYIILGYKLFYSDGEKDSNCNELIKFIIINSKNIDEKKISKKWRKK